MNDKVKILIDEVRRLSDLERASLIDALDQEFGDANHEWDQSWIAELDRRKSAISEGRMPIYDVATTMDELRARLADRRTKK